MPATRLRSLALAGSVLLAGLPTPTPVDAQAPQFRSGAELIALDVAVVDEVGRPRPGLHAEDFSVTIDGGARRVRSAEFVSLRPGDRPGQGLLASGQYASNQWAVPGRVIVLVVDQGSVRAGGSRPVLAAAAAFLDRLAPGDRVGLVTLPGGGPLVELTTDRTAIRAALDRVTGQAHPVATTYNLGLAEAVSFLERDQRWEAVVQRECHERYTDRYLRLQCRGMMEQDAQDVLGTVRQATVNSLGALQQLLVRLASVDGPKTLVLLSEGMVTGTPQNPSLMAETRHLRLAAGMAGASVYVLHLQGRMLEMGKRVGPTSAEDEALRRFGVDALATQTRGAVFPVVNDGASAFERIGLETSGYYLLGVEPTRAERDGKPHALRVRVKRDGLTVRSRADVLLAPPRVSNPSIDDDLARLLQTPGSRGLLPVSVGTYAYEDATGTPRVVIAAALDRDATTPSAFSIGYAIADQAGRVVASAIDETTLEAVDSGGLRRYHYTTAPHLGPGSYLLRLAAIQGQGRRGVVEHRFVVGPRAAGEPAPSDLLLFDGGRPADGSLTPVPDGLVSGSRLGLHVKIQGAAMRDGTRVRMAVARDLEAPPLVEGDGQVSVEASSGHALFDATLDVAGLPPGDYVARAVVTGPGREPTIVLRPFRLQR